MALSGVYALSRDFDDLAQEILELLQVIGDGETITTAMKDKIKPTVNNLIKKWEDQGNNLWKRQEGTLFLQVGQGEYDFTNTNPVATVSQTHVTNSFVETSLTADAGFGTNTVTVNDATEINSGDRLGVIGSDNTLYWREVFGAPVGDVVTLATNLGTNASSGTPVYVYPDVDLIPISRITDVRRRDSTDYEIPINFESREDYFNLPNKTQQGNPIQAYYSRQEPQGIMYLWTTPSSSTSIINFTYDRQSQIIDSDADNFDMPDYWIQALVFGSANLLTYKFSTSPERRQQIREDAVIYLDEALSYDDAVYDIEVKMQQHA